MSRNSRVLDSVLLAALLATTAGTYQVLDLKFDAHGRITLPATATNPGGGEGDPPSGPPNLQCPC